MQIITNHNFVKFLDMSLTLFQFYDSGYYVTPIEQHLT